MGCTVSKRKPLPADDSKKPSTKKSSQQQQSRSASSASGSGSGSDSEKGGGGARKGAEPQKKGALPPPQPKSLRAPSNVTDVSKLVTEKIEPDASADRKQKKERTVEEKSAKIPTSEEDGGKTPLDAGQTPRPGGKLLPPKPDNGEYINFNDVLDDYSESEKDVKEKPKEGSEKKAEAKKDSKKEEASKKGEKQQPSQPGQSAAPKQDKAPADRRSARSADEHKQRREKKSSPADLPLAAKVPLKPTDALKIHEKDAVKKMRTGASRTRPAPHEDTLYQVPHRMPEVDFTKLH